MMIKHLLFILSLFCLLLSSNSYAFTPPAEEYVADASDVLLLHCDGTDASTTIPDSSTTTNKGNATVQGTAQLDTANYKFETAALLLDGDSDYITYADSADWTFGTGDFTIDFWVYLDTTNLNQDLICHMIDNSHIAWTTYSSGNGRIWLQSNIHDGASWGRSSATYLLSTTTWTHLAFVMASQVAYLYKDGASQSWGYSTGDIAEIPDIATVLSIGNQTSTATYLDGSFDEIRIGKGIARDWAVARKVINIAYGVDIGQFNHIGTPLWSCRIKLEKIWRNFKWRT